MKIIACLGNPGKKYKKTRHNIGFIIGDYLFDKFNVKTGKKSFSSVSGTVKISGLDTVIIQPQTYMNNSGTAVQKAMKYYKSDHNDLIVIHDEIELPFADFREKSGGGHKGHNGLRSIIQETGSADFHRIRFGVGRPENSVIEVADHVLSNFSKEELSRLVEIIPDVFEMLCSLLKKSDSA